MFHSHSLLDKRYTRTIAGWVLRGLQARVLACSEFAARPLKMLLPTDTVQVIYNGVSDHGFCPRNSNAGPIRVGIFVRDESLHDLVLTGTDVIASGLWPRSDREPCALETSVPGVLAAGDIRAGSVKRVGFAVGDGSLAVTCAHRLASINR